MTTANRPETAADYLQQIFAVKGATGVIGVMVITIDEHGGIECRSFGDVTAHDTCLSGAILQRMAVRRAIGEDTEDEEGPPPIAA